MIDESTNKVLGALRGGGGIFRLALKLGVAVLVGWLAVLLFGQVLPRRVALGVGIVLGLLELAGAASGGNRGPLRLTLKLGEVVLTWPLAALAFQFIGVTDRGTRIGLAAAIAAGVGMAASRHGSGRESARLLTLMLAMAVPVYAVARAVVAGQRLGMVAACLAAAVAPVTAGVANVWPDGHHSRLLAAAFIALAAAVANAALMLL